MSIARPGVVSLADAHRLVDAMQQADDRRPRGMLASTRADLMSSANHYTPEPPRLGTRELRKVEMMLALPFTQWPPDVGMIENMRIEHRTRLNGEWPKP